VAKTGSLKSKLQNCEGNSSVSDNCDKKCSDMAVSDNCEGQISELPVSVLEVPAATKKKTAQKYDTDYFKLGIFVDWQ
jgi:hypothetical protein